MLVGLRCEPTTKVPLVPSVQALAIHLKCSPPMQGLECIFFSPPETRSLTPSLQHARRQAPAHDGSVDVWPSNGQGPARHGKPAREQQAGRPVTSACLIGSEPRVLCKRGKGHVQLPCPPTIARVTHTASDTTPRFACRDVLVLCLSTLLACGWCTGRYS